MEAARKLATATWLVIVLYIFASRFIRLAVGPILTDLLVFLLAIAGLIVVVVCLFLVPRYGRKGILIPALIGLLINTLVLCIWIPNFLSARERAQQTDGQ
jgi:Mn2+/Fe2+ NRAMP family transporter